MSRQSDPELIFGRQLRALKLPAAVLEHQFHEIRRWRFDFAWPEQMIALEIEGATWSGGRHVRGAAFEDDCVKYAEAAIAGWRLIRVTSSMVDDGRAVALLERALNQQRGDR